jgi:hypothetical protein
MTVIHRRHRTDPRCAGWSAAQKRADFRSDSLVWYWLRQGENIRDRDAKLDRAIEKTGENMTDEQETVLEHWINLLRHPCFAVLGAAERYVLHLMYDRTRRHGPNVLASLRAIRDWITATHGVILHHSTVGRAIDRLSYAGWLTVLSRGRPGIDSTEATQVTLTLPTLPERRLTLAELTALTAGGTEPPWAEQERAAKKRVTDIAAELNLVYELGEPTKRTLPTYQHLLDRGDQDPSPPGERTSRLLAVLGIWTLGSKDIWGSVVAKLKKVKLAERKGWQSDQLKQLYPARSTRLSAGRRPAPHPFAAPGARVVLLRPPTAAPVLGARVRKAAPGRQRLFAPGTSLVEVWRRQNAPPEAPARTDH